jgi:pimeloyl-ACP methyl ester carboxylesterase
MDWTGWIIVGGVVVVLYVPAMATIMVLAMWWLFTPGRVNWAGPRQDDPFALGYRGDPKSGLGLDFETVKVPTELGEEEAWLVPADSGSLWAIYVHGIGGLRENGFRQLSVLHEAGITTLMIGYRNDPWGPEGRRPFYSFGLDEWRDLEAAVQWAKGRGAERIILVAESMGAGVMGQFLMRSAEAGGVVALVLDSPALDFGAVLQGFAQWAPLREVIVPLGFRLARLTLPVDLRTAVVADVVRDFRGPVFVVHGTADLLVPVTVSRDLVAARGGSTTYLETNAQHLRSWQGDRQRYRGEMLAFLRALKA